MKSASVTAHDAPTEAICIYVRYPT